MNEKPLVSVCLVAYNQERYIREAVNGALMQTYSPLEIILSDDCSIDRTYEIMCEMVAAYKGPHQVFVSQNPVNKGVVCHVNEIFERSKGELIIGMAGDDISLPDRAEVLVNEWMKHEKKPLVLYSSSTWINSGGGIIGGRTFAETRMTDVNSDFSILRKLRFAGETAAYSRELITQVKIPEKVAEDLFFFLCACVSGKILYVKDPTVCYRVHNRSLSHLDAASYFTQGRRRSEWNKYTFSAILENERGHLSPEVASFFEYRVARANVRLRVLNRILQYFPGLENSDDMSLKNVWIRKCAKIIYKIMSWLLFQWTRMKVAL